jgi:hypothetical protein
MLSREAVFSHLWMERPRLNCGPIARADVEVKNKIKHLKRLRKHVTQTKLPDHCQAPFIIQNK